MIYEILDREELLRRMKGINVWIVVDVVCAGLYVYKELYFTAVLYALYAIIAIFGYRKWKQLMS